MPNFGRSLSFTLTPLPYLGATISKVYKTVVTLAFTARIMSMLEGILLFRILDISICGVEV